MGVCIWSSAGMKKILRCSMEKGAFVVIISHMSIVRGFSQAVSVHTIEKNIKE